MSTVRAGYYESCKGGHLKAADVDCYNAAKDEAALEACQRAELSAATGGKASGSGSGGAASAGSAPVPALPDTHGPATPEHTKAFEDACTGGNAAACFHAGMRHAIGVGASPDEAVGSTWFVRGCDGNDAEACAQVASRYGSGRGLPSDVAKAIATHEKACGLAAKHCGAIASYYFRGEGIAKDPAKGQAALEKACDAGDGLSCENLAERLADGLDIPADPPRAVVMAQRACDADPMNCAILGDFYVSAVGGLAEDRAKGLALIQKSCDQGKQRACDMLRP